MCVKVTLYLFAVNSSQAMLRPALTADDNVHVQDSRAMLRPGLTMCMYRILELC